MANTTGKKYGGRTKGTPNKDTKQLRLRIESLLKDNWNDVLNDLDSLKPKDRIDAYLRLLEYSLPKLNRTEILPYEEPLTQEEIERELGRLGNKLLLELDQYNK